MFAVERTYANGSTTLYGPIFRRKTAYKVVDRLDAGEGNFTHDTEGVSVRVLTPWRKAFKK